MSDRIASAVFDNQEEAKRAMTELRSAGIDQKCISIVGRHGEQDNMDEVDGDGEMNAGGTVKGAVGGAVVGGLLGVAALAIPGVGPLAAAGAIASGAIPGAAALGAGAGAVAGGIAGMLTNHGVSEEDATYYESRINDGGIFLSVDADESSVPVETAQEILLRNGGHNSTQARTTAM